MIPAIAFPIVAAGGALAVWYYTRKTPREKVLREAPELDKKGSGRRFLQWREADARNAACAGVKAGLTDEQQLAIAVAEVLYIGRDWPPPAQASARQKKIWERVVQTTRDALAGGCDG